MCQEVMPSFKLPLINVALPLYYSAQYCQLPLPDYDTTIDKCNEALEILKHSDNDISKLLQSRAYNCIMESHLGKSQFQDAEDSGKKSLEITNDICDRESALVEWTLHLLCRAMIGEKKFFFAEGLLRRLDSIITTLEEKYGAEFQLYQIQYDTLVGYADVMKMFNRESELAQLQSRIKKYTKGKDCKSNLLLHTRFDSPVWKRWEDKDS